MKTVYTLLTPDHTGTMPRINITEEHITAAGETNEIDWPAEPSLAQIKHLVLPLLGANEDLDHVNVHVGGTRHDMFVAETGGQFVRHRGQMPVNFLATRIYRAGWMSAHCKPEDEARMAAMELNLGHIYGNAVIFIGRLVWK